MAKATTRRSGPLDNLTELMAGAQHGKRKNGVQNSSVAEAANQIRVKSVCYNVNPDATTTLFTSHYRFAPPPARCTQCFGDVITDPTMIVKPWCYWERVSD